MSGYSPGAVLELRGQTMGTTWSVQLPETAMQSISPHDTASVEHSVLAELQRINSLMSTWDPESELSRFNHSRSIEPQVLHADTLQVIDTAQRVSWLSDQRYDITLAPVIDLWGFGVATNRPAPTDEQIRQALSAVGSRLLVRTGSTLRKRRPQVRIDVSSLAKGFAVDQLGRVLEDLGAGSYLVEIGGEIRTRGYREPGQPWKVGIETPQASVDDGLNLVNAHVASSGSYRNYREENGKRLSHIIDGRTGRPVEHSLVAVTVVHESTMLADAWATALLVVGEEHAHELIDQLELAAQLVWRSGNGFQIYRSPSFASLML